MSARARLLAIVCCLAAAACGGGSPASGGSTPTAPAPVPTVPTSAACSAVGSLNISQAQIVNGSDCNESSGSVVLINLFASDGSANGQCSGTIIGARSVLTAAHCAEGAATARIFTGSFPQIPASRVVAHPAYRQSAGSASDVAIVTADGDLGRPPIPVLTSRDVRTGETVVISGWGKDANQNSARLRAGSTIITIVTPDVIQTQFSASTAFVCQGDSGGPLLVQEGGTWTVAGVISANTNTACNSGNNYYAAVRSASVLSFLSEQAPDAVVR
jgi:V8-like Glu-specific endopeptidase